MAKKVQAYVKLQVAADGYPSPPVGPALGSAGCKHHGILQSVQRKN